MVLVKSDPLSWFVLRVCVLRTEGVSQGMGLSVLKPEKSPTILDEVVTLVLV